MEGPKLKRSLTMPLVVLYGLGTTVGAGIYVLIGAAAGRAGLLAPLAFILAAIGIAPTAAIYAELVGRFPVSSGEAAYVRGGFNSRLLSDVVGWLVIVSGVVAGATIAIGCAGYIREFVDLPQWVVVIGVVSLIGVVAAWGILESIVVASLFTLIEVGGLLVLVFFGFTSDVVDLGRVPEAFIVNDFSLMPGIASAGLLAVFAFIGFEDMINVAEETKNPKRAIPWAIFLTLGITTLLYVLVTLVAVLAVAPSELAASEAPLSLVYERITGSSPIVLSVIAIFATTNTVLIQLIMVARVIYGMAEQRSLPKVFARVNSRTRTPVFATVVVTVVTLLLSLAFELDRLAELTSQLVIVIWALTNAALVFIKLRHEPPPEGVFVAPLWLGVVGTILMVALLVISLWI